MIRYPFFSTSKIVLVILSVSACLFLFSCSKNSCYTPSTLMMVISHYDSTTGDTAATVRVYKKGKAFTLLTSVSETSIKTSMIPAFATDGVVNFTFSFGFDYIITFKPSNTQHRLSNLDYGMYYPKSGLFNSHKEKCVNTFSCQLDDHAYNREQTEYTNNTSPSYIVSID